MTFIRDSRPTTKRLHYALFIPLIITINMDYYYFSQRIVPFRRCCTITNRWLKLCFITFIDAASLSLSLSLSLGVCLCLSPSLGRVSNYQMSGMKHKVKRMKTNAESVMKCSANPSRLGPKRMECQPIWMESGREPPSLSRPDTRISEMHSTILIYPSIYRYYHFFFAPVQYSRMQSVHNSLPIS